jgi:hypothetical protein
VVTGTSCLDGTAEQPANKGTAALNEAALNGLVALYDSEEKEKGKATNRVHATRSAFTTPIPAPFTPKRSVQGLLCPYPGQNSSQHTHLLCSHGVGCIAQKVRHYLVQNQHQGGYWIILLINKEKHLAHFKAKQNIGGKFIAVSWITELIYKTINYEGIICLLTPLIITPLFLDTNPKQAPLSPTGGTDQPYSFQHPS